MSQRSCPGRSCAFCGGLLSRESCRDMRVAMENPETRKRLVSDLTAAFRKPDAVAATERTMRKRRKERS